MPRILSAATPTSVVMAGDLRAALHEHMRERLRHFFLFLYTMHLIIARLHGRHGRTDIDFNAMVRAAATHQVDTGQRSGDQAYHAFDRADASVLDQPATRFDRMDAAHFCNLGLDPTLAGLCAASRGDEVLFDLYNQLKALCGNTRQMPQRVNIGPDRVIDVIHGRLAKLFLDGTAPLTQANLNGYLMEAKRLLTDYRDGQARKGNTGVAACAQVYIDELSDPERVEGLWQNVRNCAYADAQAVGADPTEVVA